MPAREPLPVPAREPSARPIEVTRSATRCATGVRGRADAEPLPARSRRLGALRAAQPALTPNRGIDDEVKRRTVGDGFARGDHRVILCGDEVGKREHHEWGTVLRRVSYLVPGRPTTHVASVLDGKRRT